MISNKLKVAVLVDCNFVKDFVYEILEDLVQSDNCQVLLYIDSASKKAQRNPLLDAYLKFDKTLNARGVDHTSEKSISKLNIDRLSSLDQDFDLIINLGTKNITDEVIELSKNGVWELRYGDAQTDANMAGVKEVFDANNTTSITLYKLLDKTGDGYIIDQFLCATHDLSPVKNRSDVVWKSHELLLKNIKKLATGNIVENRDPYFFKDKKLDFENSLFPILKLGVRNFTSRVDKLFRKQQWSVYYAVNKEGSDFNQNMSDFKEIPTPKEFFWADPFVVDKDDKSFIFFEEYVYKTHKGHLSVVEYDHKSGEMSEAKEILNTPYHLSYPFMMEHEGEIYMIPEGSKDNDVKLYKATNFPYEWEVVKILLADIVAVDTTLFYKDDTWWLFANVASKEGFSLNEELSIYHCKDFLKDNWTPHSQNPVVSSLQTSRPAGSIMEYKGEYYRPSQNSVGWYGRSTNFNKIIKLTKDEYEEEFVSEITPEFVEGIYAVHTYNSSKKLTVIDGLKKIRRFF